VEPSDDPLLDVRANVYLISGKQRRAAEPVKSDVGAATEVAMAAT
jgi:catalase